LTSGMSGSVGWCPGMEPVVGEDEAVAVLR
jgi:hypothetical protein